MCAEIIRYTGSMRYRPRSLNIWNIFYRMGILRPLYERSNTTNTSVIFLPACKNNCTVQGEYVSGGTVLTPPSRAKMQHSRFNHPFKSATWKGPDIGPTVCQGSENHSNKIPWTWHQRKLKERAGFLVSRSLTLSSRTRLTHREWDSKNWWFSR